jgi:hypothetical protein
MISSDFLAALTADSLEGSKRVTRTQLRPIPGRTSTDGDTR